MAEIERAPAAQKPRKRGAARLSALVPGMIEPILRQRGFANAAILTQWSEIAGPELARFSAPLEIRWPKRRAEPGEQRTIRSAKTEKAEKAVLVVQVASAFALDLQMASARLIEGLNRRLGFDCIGAIQIRQGTLPAKPTRQRRLAPDPALIAELRAGLHDIESDRLKDALATLGAEISRKSASGKF